MLKSIQFYHYLSHSVYKNIRFKNKIWDKIVSNNTAMPAFAFNFYNFRQRSLQGEMSLPPLLFLTTH